VAGVWRRYGRVTAVADVSLHVGAGEFLSLLGPSGSGKTTLLMMLAGFEQPDAGRLAVGDRDLTRVPPNKRGVAMVFQRYALFPHMTVAENIAFPLRTRGIGRSERETRIGRALSVVKLDEFAGRKRRLGATVIYVTHDQEEALTMSDRVAVMDGGRLVRLGTPRDLYDRPATPFVAGFIGETNLLPGTVRAASGPACLLDLGGGTRSSLQSGRSTSFCLRPATGCRAS